MNTRFLGGQPTSTLRRTLKCAFAASLLLLCTTLMLAQSTATLQGTVSDAKGGLIANATIDIRSAATGKTKTVTADAAGHYSASGLLPGTYTVTAAAPGFSELVKTSVVVSETGADLALTLQIGSATTDITVDADATHSVAAALAPWTLCSPRPRRAPRSPRP